jgi:hypothetical protein
MITGMDLLGAWVRGWAVSRAAPPPVDEPDGLRVDVGLPDVVPAHVPEGEA